MKKSLQHNHLDRSKYGLVELPVVEYGGLVWISATSDKPIDIQHYLGAVGDNLVHFGVADHLSFRKSTIVKHTNWKLLIKTYLEGYHVPFLHKNTLANAFRKGVIAHTECGSHIRLAAARTNILDVLSVEREKWRILDYASVYYSIFPNTFFIMHPDYVSLNIFHPEAPNRTVWTHEMFYKPEHFEGDKGQEALARRFEYTNDVVFNDEDFAIAERVQEGLRYGSNKHHTLGLEEGLIGIFQRNIDDALCDKTVVPLKSVCPQ
ncbi:SRPBCC family protein [Pseudochrobactrum kiredjianiae]|uniref:SRPBCC family protein n=1 Tax=Pseudochrobactrum kiredjianiae TaxID=386305 RepID=A0ABW3V047_9HYPH|nr:SRPBCC family protein [Pseudochrobactrum kiredjianiae]MDM7853204.1 SRPBCC family protein [Pseudochrobactrum kiredjianiae]